MQLFYQDKITPSDEIIIFEKEESRHIIKVLRKKKGDILYITDGRGQLLEAVLEVDEVRKCIAKIVKKEKQPNLPYQLHLAVAPTKNNDRYEWFLEKVTEIGITEITPIICDNSERKNVKLDRFERILVSAMKQSLHYYLPKLNNPVKCTDFIEEQSENDSLKLLAHCENEQKVLLSEELYKNNHNSITIMIGPEGDFSSKEISLAKDSKFTPISLGNSRLRTETAAVVACHSVSIIKEIRSLNL